MVVVKDVSCAAYSCNVDGGRMYTLEPRGQVFAVGMPRMHVEIRRVLKSSPLAMGLNADYVSIQLTDKAAFLDLDFRCSVCPTEWIKISNAMGLAT